MSTCDCFSGTPGASEYQPKGSIIKLFGYDVYQTQAKEVSHKKGHIMLLPDAFGLAKHNKVLADKFASFGFDVSILDYYRGNALPEIYLQYTPGTDLDKYDDLSEEEKEIIRSVDVSQWAQQVDPDRISSLLVPFMENFRQSLPTGDLLHIVGHCFGGIQAFRLASHSIAKSAVIMHPGPCDLKDVDNSTVPMFIGLAESDVFDPTAPQTILKALSGAEIYYKVAVYGGTRHGFASRASHQDEKASKAYVASIRDTIDWINQCAGELNN